MWSSIAERQNPKHTKETEAGFTLLEVMIALVILGVGMLMLSGAQIATIRSNSFGFKMTTAVGLAENRVQALQNLDFSDPDLTAGAHADPDTTANNILYSMNYNVTDGVPVVGIKTITYTVSWEETGTHSIDLITRKGNEL